MYSCTVLIGWDPATPPPRIWAHTRGRYWSAKSQRHLFVTPPGNNIFPKIAAPSVQRAPNARTARPTSPRRTCTSSTWSTSTRTTGPTSARTARAVSRQGLCMCAFRRWFMAVLRIHDILEWIRIRGSMPLTNGSWIRILLVSSLTFKMPTKN